MASGIGWAFDAMDVGLVSFVVTAIAADPHFNLDATQKSWVLSIGFIGMAIGAALGGFLADKLGRKTVLISTTLATLVFSLFAMQSLQHNVLTVMLFLCVGFALMEDLEVDPITKKYVSADLLNYRNPLILDMPEVHLFVADSPSCSRLTCVTPAPA